jgi:hypothetical protein
VVGVLGLSGAGALAPALPGFADADTVALWLFDEADYPHATLTDAGPHEYDLRLMSGGELVD